MTIETAIEILKPNHREHYESIDPVIEACRVAVSALEKQIPKKLKIKQKGNDVLDFRCPLCDKKIISKVGERFVAGSKDNFCLECGQALDWSE